MDKLYIIIPAFIAIFIFVYMRNKQAGRNDRRRERLWKREEELMKMLEKKKEPDSDAPPAGDNQAG
ncbi:MAG: hypothetical protein U0X40_07020 [Ferruginibacter sp.]